MAERLGIVLYWAGCILGASWVLVIRFTSSDPLGMASIEEFLLAAVPALALFLLGWGLRYTLSGY